MIRTVEPSVDGGARYSPPVELCAQYVVHLVQRLDLLLQRPTVAASVDRGRMYHDQSIARDAYARCRKHEYGTHRGSQALDDYRRRASRLLHRRYH